MARIQQYHSQISSQTGAPSPMSSPADFGVGMGDMGRSLEKVGDIADKAFADINAKKERDADLWRAQVVAEESVNWTKAIQESKISPEPGAPDLAEKFATETKSRMDELLQNAPTDTSRARLQTSLTTLYGDVVSKAVAFQAQAAAKESVGKVASISNSLENLVYLDPSKYGAANEQANALIDSLTIGYQDPSTGTARAYGLTKQAADQMKLDQQSNFASKSFEGRVDRAKTVQEVNGILSEIKGEQWQKIIPAQQYERLITNATKAGEQIAHKNDLIVLSDFNARVEAASRGLPVAAPNVAAISDPVIRAQKTREWNSARDYGVMVKQAETASPAELQTTFARLDAQASGGSPESMLAADNARQNLRRVVAQRNKEIEADPAGYVMQRVPQVGQAYQAYRDAESKVKPGDEASMLRATTARQEYFTETMAAQTRIGIPKDRVNLLSAQELAQTKSIIDNTDRTPEGAENAHRALVDTYSRYGKDYGNMVYRQLVEEKVISGVDVVAARMSDLDQQSAGVSLKRASAIGEKELLKLTNSEEKVKAEVERSVSQAMAPLAKTLATDVGGVKAATETADAARLLATYYVATKGMSVQDAVKQATNEVAVSKYHIVGSYRIPVRDHSTGAMLNPNDISAGASQILRDADKLDFALPRSLAGMKDPATRSAALASLKTYGSWSTTGQTEGGLTLRWQNGEAVMRADGKGPISFTWKELMDATNRSADVDNISIGGP